MDDEKNPADEMDREEFFRLKKVQGKKKRDEEQAEVIKRDNDKNQGIQGFSNLDMDILGEADEDVIF